MSDIGWTPTRVDTLKSLWLGGLSASVIAKALGGVTRNAVIGKVHRLGLGGRMPGGVLGEKATLQPPRPPRIRVARPPSQRTEPPVTLVEPLEGPGLVSALEHVDVRGCHWPIGDPKSDAFSFCGRPAGDGPYCRGHDRAAHQPRPVKPLMADPWVRRVLAGLVA
jgi:GcrA cell cycle regulator